MIPIEMQGYPAVDHNGGLEYLLYAHHEKEIDIEAIRTVVHTDYVKAENFPVSFCLTFWVYCSVILLNFVKTTLFLYDFRVR